MKLISALLLSALASCAAVKSNLVTFKDGAVTCLKEDEPAVKALGLELVTLAAADLLGGKSPGDTFKDVTARAEAGAKVRGIAVAACAFNDVVADLEALLHPAARTAAVAALSFPDMAQTALADFERAHGVTSVQR
jgi:hypothetical protein